VGIHRINMLFVEEFGSPADLRFRIETDIRMSRAAAGRGFIRRLRAAVASSRDETVRDLLLARLARPVQKREPVTDADLIQVRRLVVGALSNPRKKLPPEAGPRRKKRR